MSKKSVVLIILILILLWDNIANSCPFPQDRHIPLKNGDYSISPDEPREMCIDIWRNPFEKRIRLGLKVAFIDNCNALESYKEMIEEMDREGLLKKIQELEPKDFILPSTE